MGEQTDRSVRDVEFTRRWYRELLERLQSDGWTFRGFDEPVSEGDALLRHDVDLSLSAALRTAEIEAELGVTATYCVLLSSALYNPLTGESRDRIRRLAALGHDIALHFSTHEYWADPPGPTSLEARVREELDVLATLLGEETRTVSFHIPPEWVLGRSFEGFRSTYAPAYFEDVSYVADSGQRWRSEPPAFEEREGPVQILTHPGLWGEDDADFEGCVQRAIVDACRETQLAARREFIEDDVGARREGPPTAVRREGQDV